MCLLVVALLAASCAPTEASAPKSDISVGYKSIRMVGASLGSSASTAVMAFASIFNKYYPEINWSSSSGSAASNVIYLTKGDITMGYCMLSHYIAAYGFDKIPESRIRSIVQPTASYNYVWVIPEDKPWKDITQVPKGVTLSPGTPGSATTASEAWFQVSGLNKKDFNWLPLGKSELADAWRTGKVEVAMLSVSGLDPVLMDMYTSPRKIKAMGLSEQQAAKAKAERTFEQVGYSAPTRSNITEIAGEVFKYDVTSVLMPAFLNVRDDFPEAIAYKLARIIDEHNAELAQIFPAMKYSTPKWHMQSAGPPYDIHPGVAKYYREKGYLR